MSLLERISIDADTLHGKPRVRNTRIPVSMVLELLAAGHSPDGRDLYFGLLRLGVDAPGLLPPQKEEPLP